MFLNKGLNVLSLFDGMSCGRIALGRSGIAVNTYHAAEIDKYATQVSHANYPDIIRLGDVTLWREWDIDWSSIDLLLGGFPCQAWSMAGKQQGDKDERGMLFWVMLDIFKHVQQLNPDVKFLIENVKMKKEFEEYITHHTEQALGHVEKHLINSALVSGQNRQRYYWCNWSVEQPEDKGIMLRDIIEPHGDFTYMSEKFVNRQQGRKCLRDNLDGKRADTKVDSMVGITEQRLELRKDDKSGTLTTVQKDNLIVRPCELRETQPAETALCHHVATATDINANESNKRVYADTGKSPTLTTMGGGHREPKVLMNNVQYRKLTPIECERLQTVPDNYTNHVSNTQRYKMLGNGWTVDVIKHILDASGLHK